MDVYYGVSIVSSLVTRVITLSDGLKCWKHGRLVTSAVGLVNSAAIVSLVAYRGVAKDVRGAAGAYKAESTRQRTEH